MVIKVYFSSVTGIPEVNSRQKLLYSILETKQIKYAIVDVSQDSNKDEKEYMIKYATQSGGTKSQPNPEVPFTPQIFNDGVYCGDYNSFEVANELGTLKEFLKING
ncbi:unnamed protein product [Brassicogethes aeneus]|uniref:SH3 domain-binding glutamic acid-rich-like protein n=1 Tax=Brassicogethes aeneus TaxID=1431903 RepID=A0A9P0FJF6_BRAAE|nr:unnamed protein product [Brassicogethes aeneus]